MSSKGFYKSNVPPRLIHAITSPASVVRWEHRNVVVRRSVEVWTTPCVVTCFGKKSVARCDALINPGNPDLSGVKNFPYFPRGGPVPSSDHRHRDRPISSFSSERVVQAVDGPHRDWQPLGYVSNWGGMEVGSGMMYPVTVVDGLVHMHGGRALQMEIALLRRKLSLLRSSDDHPLCPVGEAVVTSSGLGSTLSKHYDAIVHTTPPFYQHDASPQLKLRSCYRRSMELAAFAGTTNGFVASLFAPDTLRPVRVAVPLLGSGARGFPADVAMSVAAQASAEDWLMPASPDRAARPQQGSDDTFEQTVDHPVSQTLAFGLLEDSLAEDMASCLDGAVAGLHKA